MVLQTKADFMHAHLQCDNFFSLLNRPYKDGMAELQPMLTWCAARNLYADKRNSKHRHHQSSHNFVLGADAGCRLC